MISLAKPREALIRAMDNLKAGEMNLLSTQEKIQYEAASSANLTQSKITKDKFCNTQKK